MPEQNNIEKLPLFELTSKKISSDDELQTILRQIDASDLKEWIKLHLTSKAYLSAGKHEAALGIIDGGLLHKMPEEERWRAAINGAICLLKLQKYREALEHTFSYSYTTPKDKEWMLYMWRGNIFYTMKRYAAASECFSKELESNPPENIIGLAYLDLESCHMYLQQYQKGADAINEALKRGFPAENLYAAYADLSSCYFTLGRYREALSADDNALAANPPEEKVCELFIRRAECNFNFGQYQSALDDCKKTMAKNPPKELASYTHILAAACCCELKQYAAGLEFCELALNYGPPSAEDYSRWKFWNGQCLLAMGHVKEARTRFAESNNIEGSDFYCELCDKIIENKGTVVNGILTMQL